MLPERALVAPAAGVDFAGAKEELRQFLAQRADAIEKRREREAKAIESSKSFSYPGSSDALSDEGVPQPPSAAPDAPATRGLPTEPPQRVETAEERMARVNSVPAIPPRGPREEWRDYIGADGAIISPWFIPHG